ncbi:MAG: FHIPEP family type III secretion protein [Lachnospiraceae bacterium]|nr:FHIPEP family type III secretion protein [Lachnospiraceae bacterium]
MLQNIGENISRFRQNQNMTQEEFASRLGVTPQAVSKWERGASLPDIALVSGICQLLKVHADALLGIEIIQISENKNALEEKKIRQNLIADPLRIEVGAGLVPCIVEGLKTDYVNQCRRKLADETGMLLPIIRIMDMEGLEQNEVRIVSYDKVLRQKQYEKEQSETELQMYCSMVNEAVRLCRENYDRILNKQLVKCLLDNLQEQYPGVLDGLVPDKVSYYEVMIHLRSIIEKKGSIHDLIHIMEELECRHWLSDTAAASCPSVV